MYRILSFLAFSALAACGPSTSKTDVSVDVGHADTKGPCSDVTTLQAARSDTPPFSSLRGAPVMRGDTPVRDTWYAKADYFGSDGCTIAALRDVFDTKSDFHIAGCDVFVEPSSLDREENEQKARRALEETRANLESCLGDSWIMTESDDDPNFDIYHRYTFKPQGYETPFSLSADPAYLEMSFSRFPSRSRPAGWMVKLQFQEQIASEPASNQE